MIRPGLSRIGQSLRQTRRSIHHVPPLPHNFQNGIQDFLSPAAVQIAWTQYQSLIVSKLNALTAGGDYESKPPKDIAIKYARDPNSAPVFNYASMAHNNHFFFSCLSPKETEIPEYLEKELISSFSSIETLKREMVITASSMFGPGFVWLVKSKETSMRNYSLLTTYLAGSPYPGAHFRRQEVDMNTGGGKSSVSSHIRDVVNRPPVNSVGAFGPLSKVPLPPGGIELNPILCINTWEHVWLPDYGVGGKKAYAEAWWQKINWDVVARNAGNVGSNGRVREFQT